MTAFLPISLNCSELTLVCVCLRSAEIIIHLSNEGPDAYKPENYGNRIVIERKFSKDGASSYRIKSSSGELCLKNITVFIFISFLFCLMFPTDISD